jgi:hypothetical protein
MLAGAARRGVGEEAMNTRGLWSTTLAGVFSLGFFVQEVAKTVIGETTKKGLEYAWSRMETAAPDNTYYEYFTPEVPKATSPTKAPKLVYRGTTYDTSTPSYSKSIDYSTPPAAERKATGDYVSAPELGTSDVYPSVALPPTKRRK